MTKHNALSECRDVVNGQIRFLEHELGIEDAFPTTIVLLGLSMNLTRQIQGLAATESTPMVEGNYSTKGNL